MPNDNINSGYGMTVINRIAEGRFPGKVFIVSSQTTASLVNYLQQIFKPDPQGVARFYSSVGAAFTGGCVAGRGDVIFLMPGHAETISNATAMSLAIAGVSVIGIGIGSLRPTFTLDTATTSTINIAAANIAFENCIFVANFAAIASAFTLTTGQELTFRNCEFRDTSAILNFVNIVTTDTTSNHADGLTFIDCKRIGLGATTNTTIINMLGTNDRLTIKRGYFAHLAVTAAGLMIIATGKFVTNADIDGPVCNFLGATTTTTGLLITTSVSTNSGVIRNCMIQTLDATTEILVTAASGFIFFNNYYCGVADKSGYLLPLADA